MFITHGLYKRPEYSSWEHMKSRCLNPNNYRYDRYGGRGIKLCERWRKSFPHFLEDVGPMPGPEYSIGRIDNDGHYEPGNVEWQTKQQQNRNRSTIGQLEYKGAKHTVAEWAAIIGIKEGTLHARLYAYHWTLERALNQGVRVWRTEKWLKLHKSV